MGITYERREGKDEVKHEDRDKNSNGSFFDRLVPVAFGGKCKGSLCGETEGYRHRCRASVARKQREGTKWSRLFCKKGKGDVGYFWLCNKIA